MAGSSSIFKRSQRMCTSRVRWSPIQSFPQTWSSSSWRLSARPAFLIKLERRSNSRAESCNSCSFLKMRRATGSKFKSPRIPDVIELLGGPIPSGAGWNGCAPAAHERKMVSPGNRPPPTSNPKTRSISSPRAVSIMTGTVLVVRRRRQISRPPNPGSIRSSTTRSGLKFRIPCSANRPSPMASTSNPSRRRLYASESVIRGSSSMSKMRGKPHLQANEAICKFSFQVKTSTSIKGFAQL